MTDKAIEEIIEKFNEEFPTEVPVGDNGSWAILISDKEQAKLELFLRSSLLSYGSPCREEGYKIGLIEGTMDGKEEGKKEERERIIKFIDNIEYPEGITESHGFKVRYAPISWPQLKKFILDSLPKEERK